MMEIRDRSAPLRWWHAIVLRIAGRGVWTIIGRTLYRPHGRDGCELPEHVRVHEQVHVDQWERWGVLLWLTYLLPPLLITMRGHWEWQAYRAELEWRREHYGEVDAQARYQRVRVMMRGPRYLWMDPMGLWGWRRWE